MRRLDLWSETTPSAEALASTAPFCVDTLSFPEWLQFVFLERVYLIVQQSLSLPASSGIAPLAEEYFVTDSTDAGMVIALLRRFDNLIEEQSS